MDAKRPAARALVLLVCGTLCAMALACSESASSEPTTPTGAGAGTATGSGGATSTASQGGSGDGGTPAAGGSGGAGGTCGDFPPAPNQDWQAPGPFDTTVLTTGPDDAFRIYQPDPLAAGGLQHPIVVFSVGTAATPGAYGLLLDRFASHGFVVIAGDDGNQAEGDQALAGLAWLIEQNGSSGSPWEGTLDTTRIAAVGHSQGGNTAIHVALRNTAVGAVLALMPGEGALGGATKADESQLGVPVFYTCGGNDFIVDEQWCLDRFANTVSPAWVGVVVDAGHSAPLLNNTSAIELRHWVIAWLRAVLLDDCEARELFWDDPFALAADADWRSVDRKNL